MSNDVASQNLAREAHIFEEMYVKRNIGIIDEAFAEDWVDRYSEAIGQDPTRAGLKAQTEAGWRAFPEQRLAILDMLAAGDKVVCRFTLTGRHTGADIMGIPATGNEVTFSIVVIDRFEDGLLRKSWGVVDGSSLLQMGFPLRRCRRRGNVRTHCPF